MKAVESVRTISIVDKSGEQSARARESLIKAEEEPPTHTQRTNSDGDTFILFFCAALKYIHVQAHKVYSRSLAC